MTTNEEAENTPRTNFIRQIIDRDLESGKHQSVVTRFPPEPNGYLHMGHAKSICLNFGLARDYNGRCHLRFDDTNPEKESVEYVESIQEDVKWLGFDWNDHLYFASDYFEDLYNFAVELIKRDKAYVCELTPEQIREYRGNLKEPGKDSPFRNRPVAESLDLFTRMRAGEFADGAMCLRAKIDMGSSNINMRDPVIYRIRRAHHHRTGDKWCIYPMYDYTHCLSDMLETITHSICTLEFEDHRPLYDWVLDTLETPCHPQQIEFSKLNPEFTLLSKRNLLRMINEGRVSGWDDPRMPTIRGMRRRGFTPESIRAFCDQIGVTKKDSWISMSTLEHCVRGDLESRCARAFGVIHPIKVVITNWEEGKVQEIEAAYHPQDESFGTRMVPMTREIYIEQDDFMENPPKKYFRLSPGGYVRLKYSYVLKCNEVIKDENGAITELRCEYFPDTFAGQTPEGFPKVKGIVNWVSASHGIKIENRLYDRMFTHPRPGSDIDKAFGEWWNNDSLQVVTSYIEPALGSAKVGERFQFERQGYFMKDMDSTESAQVWNRIITLKDTWAKVEKEFKN